MDKRDYFRCRTCDLIFCEPTRLLPPDEEVKRYTGHQNDVRTDGYVSFLRRLLDPVLARVSANSAGLDFGSGPYPMMTELAQESGFELSAYDPYFAPEKELLERRYDFVTCCEVAEHFYNPLEGFTRLFGLLRPGGVLGVMTSVYSDGNDFSKWWYVHDPTHVSIYTARCMEWIARNWGATLVLASGNVFLFTVGER